LGGGAFGDVYKAYLKTENNKVACKLTANHVMSGKSDDRSAAAATPTPALRMSLKDSIESILNEINAHREIRSAFLCKLFGYSVMSNEICLILEYMQNGSLLDIKEKENESENFVFNLFFNHEFLQIRKILSKCKNYWLNSK
jgi:serine/threonine protein kinase